MTDLIRRFESTTHGAGLWRASVKVNEVAVSTTGAMRDVVRSEHPRSQEGAYLYPLLQTHFMILGMRAHTSTRSGDLFAGETTRRQKNELCITYPLCRRTWWQVERLERRREIYHKTRTTTTTVYRRRRRRTRGGKNGRGLLRLVKMVVGR